MWWFENEDARAQGLELVRQVVRELGAGDVQALGELTDQVHELTARLDATERLAAARPVSLETLAELGMLDAMTSVVDQRLSSAFAAALADDDLGNAAADQLRKASVGIPTLQGEPDLRVVFEHSVRAAARALAGYVLAWLEQHPSGTEEPAS